MAASAAAFSPSIDGSGVTSSPTSTQGGLSARSHASAGPEMHHCQSFSSQIAAAASSAVEPRPPWLVDLSREIQVMRHVILQENARLREQILQGQAQAAALAPAAELRTATLGPRVVFRSRAIEWRIAD